MLQKKACRELVEVFEKRRHNVIEFINAFDKDLIIEPIRLTDPFGPYADGRFNTILDYDSIIVSEETLQGGNAVNDKRLKEVNSKGENMGLKPLKIFVSGIIYPSTCPTKHSLGDKTSSSQIRKNISKLLGDDLSNIDFLKQQWQIACSYLSVPEEQTRIWYWKLFQLYAEGWRKYHNIKHVSALLQQISKESSLSAQDRCYLILAAYFHDAIYIPQSKDNELESAMLLKRFFDDAVRKEKKGEDAKEGLSTQEQAMADSLYNLILQTKNHLSSDPQQHAKTLELDLFFLDLDLNILASEEKAYFEYANNIRAEYSHFNDEQFNKGRLAFLKNIVKYEKIFRSERLKSLNEKAFGNMNKEIQVLEERISALEKK